MKNVLPAPYSPRTALNAEPPPAAVVQVGVHGRDEPVQPDGEQVQAADRDGSPAQRVDDLAAAARRDWPVTADPELLAQQRLVQDWVTFGERRGPGAPCV